MNRNTLRFPEAESFARVALLLEQFILDYCSHEHDSDDAEYGCSLCRQLNLARHALDSLAYMAAAAFAASVLRAKKTAKIGPFFFVIPITLVFLKVKSNT